MFAKVTGNSTTEINQAAPAIKKIMPAAPMRERATRVKVFPRCFPAFFKLRKLLPSLLEIASLFSQPYSGSVSVVTLTLITAITV